MGRSVHGWASVVLLAGSSLAGMSAPGSVPEPPVSVHGDQGRQAFVGTGQMGTDSGGGDSSSGGCAGCAWLVEPVCTIDDMGTPPVPGLAGCRPVAGDCPQGQTYVRVWTSEGGSWRAGATRCSPQGPGVSIAELTSAATSVVRHRVPAVRPSRQPAGRAVINVPVLFDSGQRPGAVEWTDSILGLAVTTKVEPTWTWTFGDGATLRTRQAGSVYPDTTVSHTFRRPGRFRVGVECQWRGSFTVDGLGTFAIDGTVTRAAELAVVLRSAGAVLVPNP